MKSHPPGEPAGVDHLIERQMLFRTARDRAAREQPPDRASYPLQFVTISRDPGSLGEEVAADLGQRLRWRVYDREIVEAISRDSKARESLVRQLDEKSQTLLDDTVKRLFGMAEGATLSVETYHHSLVRTLVSIAIHGQAILIGRGANFALHGHPGMHVRIVANPQIRAVRLATAWKVDEREAIRRCQKLDEERRAFIRQHYKHDLDDPRFYDAVFSTDSLPIEQVATSILAAMGLPPEGFRSH